MLVKIDMAVKNWLKMPPLPSGEGVDMAGVRQFDEEEALEKALALFWQRGFAETSMQELAAVTGVQRGSLYNAYQGKEAFFLRVFEVYTERFLTQVRESLEQPALRDGLRSFFDYIISSMRTGVPTRGCLSTKIALGGDVIEEPIRAALQGLLDMLEAILRERLSHPEKGVRLAVPAAEAARLIVAFTRGIVVIERVYQDEARMREMAESVTTLILGTPGRTASKRA
jgi:TetR/AcrR family transcriptional repressor of nem operon